MRDNVGFIEQFFFFTFTSQTWIEHLFANGLHLKEEVLEWNSIKNKHSWPPSLCGWRQHPWWRPNDKIGCHTLGILQFSTPILSLVFALLHFYLIGAFWQSLHIQALCLLGQRLGDRNSYTLKISLLLFYSYLFLVKLVKVGELLGGNPRLQILLLHLSVGIDLRQRHWLNLWWP